MRFTLVAGALVLSASVSEGRSLPSSPSRSARTTLVRIEALNVRIGTPVHISKRAQEGDWDPAATPKDVPSNSAHPPNTTETNELSQKSHPKQSGDGSRVDAYSEPDSNQRSQVPAFENTISSLPTAAESPLASTLETPTSLSSENMQFTIKPVGAVKNLSNQPHGEQPSPVYIIMPISSAAATTIAQKVKSSSGAIETVDEVNESGEPITALLRAIENYRKAVSQGNPSGSVA